jgi:hypothetical protein
MRVMNIRARFLAILSCICAAGPASGMITGGQAWFLN